MLISNLFLTCSYWNSDNDKIIFSYLRENKYLKWCTVFNGIILGSFLDSWYLHYFFEIGNFVNLGVSSCFGVSTGPGNLQRDNGIVKLDSAGLLLCEISTWPTIILKYSCIVSRIMFHIVFTGLSHSGNRGPWVKLKGVQKPLQLEISLGLLIIFCKVERGLTLFEELKSTGPQ